MRKARRRFTKEFKQEVIRLILDGGQRVPDVCTKYELTESNVYGWVKQARIDRAGDSGGALTSSERDELIRIRRENRELKRERDFFEQATVYFSGPKK